MVGRIVVGRPGGPGARPPGEDVPAAAQVAFPSVERIIAEGFVWPKGLSTVPASVFPPYVGDELVRPL